MSRQTLVLVSLVALLAGCKKPIDPVFKAGLEARHDAICACQQREPAAVAGCYEDAQKDHPEPHPPRGLALGEYREGLNAEGDAFFRKIEEQTSQCDVAVSKAITSYKESVEELARKKKQEDEAKALSEQQQAAKRPAPPAKAAAKRGKKKHH